VVTDPPGPVPDPPHPFTAFTYRATRDTGLYRVCSAGPTRRIDDFNPGYGPGGRFSFFGDPPVPVLYAAETELAALCETVLHDVPATGGIVPSAAIDNLVAGRLVLARDLALADFSGVGLRRLGVDPEQLTSSPAYTYHRTRRWARAAYDAGFEGIVWMSKRCNDARAFVLFGDRIRDRDVSIDHTYARVFATGPDRDWLINTCAQLHIDVLAPQPSSDT